MNGQDGRVKSDMLSLAPAKLARAGHVDSLSAWPPGSYPGRRTAVAADEASRFRRLFMITGSPCTAKALQFARLVGFNKQSRQTVQRSAKIVAVNSSSSSEPRLAEDGKV